ncbi:MAG TPA: hypothetical protein DCZ01_07410 [Elusimicrobia bacterium]|nr:MAG: hypothetical protein A2X37_06555 [Elusimicrobia bacterium GWA2_66_18]OGR72326.1 MAG: hypothetical protein A2X40_06960 [Elusimicrobia bacterium GWC2_65_9]HAZ08333.1 hypothetical protein [Elusimicrobiota bacterium]
MMKAIFVFLFCVHPRSSAAAGAPVAGGMPVEIVIKAEAGAGKLNDTKPALTIDIDPFETIRPALKPDENLLLAVSPLTVSWRRTHPEFLRNERVIQPWRTTFSQRPGISFMVRDSLETLLGGKLEAKDARKWGWQLTIADEEGRVFHHYEGSGDPPEGLIWSGQNDQGEWVRAGRSYSAIYTFTSPDGSPRTSVGKPILFKGIVHQEDTGLYVSMDSSALFGASKNNAALQSPTGVDVLRSAADLIKRKYSAIPIAVRVFANTKELGDQQAKTVQEFLLRELMVASRHISTDATRASFSDQRVEVVLLNR